eukprot:gene16355-biopygen5895
MVRSGSVTETFRDWGTFCSDLLLAGSPEFRKCHRERQVFSGPSGVFQCFRTDLKQHRCSARLPAGSPEFKTIPGRGWCSPHRPESRFVCAGIGSSAHATQPGQMPHRRRGARLREEAVASSSRARCPEFLCLTAGATPFAAAPRPRPACWASVGRALRAGAGVEAPEQGRRCASVKGAGALPPRRPPATGATASFRQAVWGSVHRCAARSYGSRTVRLTGPDRLEGRSDARTLLANGASNGNGSLLSTHKVTKRNAHVCPGRRNVALAEKLLEQVPVGRTPHGMRVPKTRALTKPPVRGARLLWGPEPAVGAAAHPITAAPGLVAAVVPAGPPTRYRPRRGDRRRGLGRRGVAAPERRAAPPDPPRGAPDTRRNVSNIPYLWRALIPIGTNARNAKQGPHPPSEHLVRGSCGRIRRCLYHKGGCSSARRRAYSIAMGRGKDVSHRGAAGAAAAPRAAA